MNASRRGEERVHDRQRPGGVEPAPFLGHGKIDREPGCPEHGARALSAATIA
jgi:hypothetical protein